MKTRCIVRSCCFALLFVGAISGFAQPKFYQMVISGTSWTTNSQGVIVPTAVNNRTILQELGQRGGVTDTSSWILAYHIHGNDLGDTIEVIDTKTGGSLTTVFGLYFGEDASLGRMGLLSGSHRQMKRVEYVYTDQSSHSLGSALLTNYNWFDSNGNLIKTAVLGQMQWIVTQDGTHDRVKVCSASFTTTKPWR